MFDCLYFIYGGFAPKPPAHFSGLLEDLIVGGSAYLENLFQVNL
jgi:hypothetical protein